jgi:hypothetical protein
VLFPTPLSRRTLHDHQRLGGVNDGWTLQMSVESLTEKKSEVHRDRRKKKGLRVILRCKWSGNIDQIDDSYF